MIAAALAYASTLAFAGWWLWLRDRRGVSVDEKLVELVRSVVALERETSDLPALRSQIESLALKAGLRPRA